MTGHAPELGHSVQAPAVSTRLLTLPNLLSVLRLFGVPLFLYLVLGPHADGWAIIVLMVSGATDYVDGKLARAWNQITRLGQLLDPLADRLYILATLYGLTARHILPLWLALAIVGRDVALSTTLPLLRRHGYGPLQVSFLGKAATFNLLYAFPWLLGTAGSGWLARLSHPFAWAFTIWGSSLYWLAGALYVVQVWQLVRADSGGRSGQAVAGGAQA